jgi:hypothetical protein
MNPLILYFWLKVWTDRHSPAPLKVRKFAGRRPDWTLERLRGWEDNLSWIIIERVLITSLVWIYLGDDELLRGSHFNGIKLSFKGSLPVTSQVSRGPFSNTLHLCSVQWITSIE